MPSPFVPSRRMLGALSVLLVGACDERPTASTAPTSTTVATPAPSSPAPSAPTQVRAGIQIPDSSSWTLTPVPAAKVTVRLPPDATIASSGYDASFTGRSVAIRMAGGYTVHFCDACTLPAPTIAGSRLFYSNNTDGFEGYAFEAEDAIIAERRDKDPVGAYWETTVCERVGDTPMCASAPGVTPEAAGGVQTLTHKQAVEVIAIARSLSPAP
jgi:hypothetical protein